MLMTGSSLSPSSSAHHSGAFPLHQTTSKSSRRIVVVVQSFPTLWRLSPSLSTRLPDILCSKEVLGIFNIEEILGILFNKDALDMLCI